jgi:hypothetical protein
MPSRQAKLGSSVGYETDVMTVMSIEREGQRSFAAYASHVFDISDKLMTYAEMIWDDDNEKSAFVLSHPFLGLFTSSLASAIIVAQVDRKLMGFLAVQLIPFLTILSKRLTRLIGLLSNRTKSTYYNFSLLGNRSY